ncbi:hypothetical protein Aperf_G00000026110 [Anoplocephala perfoliata]
MLSERLLSFARLLARPVSIRSFPIISSKCQLFHCFGDVHHARFATLPPVHISSYSSLTPIEFQRQSEHALQYLTISMEDLSDKYDLGSDFDVSYSSGVLTVSFGSSHGTYVLNKQAPNKQIWLSSPKSGPRRFNYDVPMHSWIDHRENINLFDLLSKEISEIVNSPVMFENPPLDS